MAALAVVAAVSVAATDAVAGPGGQNTTSVSFVSLSPAKKLLTNTSIQANKTDSPVVIGASTTVPADATTVQLSISVTGTASGVLNFYPADDSSGGSGQFVEWAAHSTGTGIIQENPGQSGELTFYNVSSAAAKVTATITGYSTQVTAGDVNGSGGVAGQALINNGDGTASWGSALPSSPTRRSRRPTSTSFTGLHFVQVAEVSVPVGDFDVTYTGDGHKYRYNSMTRSTATSMAQLPMTSARSSKRPSSDRRRPTRSVLRHHQGGGGRADNGRKCRRHGDVHSEFGRISGAYRATGERTRGVLQQLSR